MGSASTVRVEIPAGAESCVCFLARTASRKRKNKEKAENVSFSCGATVSQKCQRVTLHRTRFGELADGAGAVVVSVGTGLGISSLGMPNISVAIAVTALAAAVGSSDCGFPSMVSVVLSK